MRVRKPTLAGIATLVVGAGIAVGSGGLALLLWGNPTPPAVVAAGTLPPIAAGTLPATPAVAAAEPQLSAPGPASAPPIRVELPSIRLSSPLVALHVQNDGTLEVPPDPATAGWWSDGPAPGDPGAAIIVGHVDSLRGPAAFYRLSSLRPADKVLIHREDKTVAVFVVDALRQFSKGAFPSDLVYGPTPTPTLRLLTCGGAFDRSSGHYTDNLVVFAHLVQVLPAAATATTATAAATSAPATTAATATTTTAATPPPSGAVRPAAGARAKPVGAPRRVVRPTHSQPR